MIAQLPKLYTDSEASAELRCAPMTVARLRKRGLLGFTRVGRKVYITDKHIAAYLESQECAATSSNGKKTASGTSGSTTPLLDNATSLALVREITGKPKGNLQSTS